MSASGLAMEVFQPFLSASTVRRKDHPRIRVFVSGSEPRLAHEAGGGDEGQGGDAADRDV